jgi:hypothetical protein
LRNDWGQSGASGVNWYGVLNATFPQSLNDGGEDSYQGKRKERYTGKEQGKNTLKNYIRFKILSYKDNGVRTVWGVKYCRSLRI